MSPAHNGATAGAAATEGGGATTTRLLEPDRRVLPPRGQGAAAAVDCPALSSRALRSNRVVIARVQLRQGGVKRAAIGIRILGPIAAVSRATPGRELLVRAVFLVTHGDFLR